MAMNCAEEFVAKGILDRYKGDRRMIIGRTANLTEAHNGRGRCQYRNQCSQGCPFGAYFSTQSATLPAAVQTGLLTLHTHAIATEVLYDRDTRRARGVRILDAVDGSTREYTGRVVFLCASTLNSAWVLMNSATDVWPDGLGSSCGELGHNITDHHVRVGASGLVPGFDDHYHSGRRPSGIYVPRFRNLGTDRREYLRGFGYQGSASRVGWQRNIAELGFGADLKQALVEPGPWSIGLVGFGETLPHHNNQVTLDRTRKDKWGLPVLAMDCRIRENEQRMRVDMKNDAAEMLEASGVTNVWAFDDYYEFGSTIHEMGAARMGRSPKTSVLNGFNQVWDAPNVFVTDGACMTSSACQNPSLTYMALTARAAHFAAEEMKRGNL
jgi:choline dehydrogenase-like flavoprotein